MPLAGVAIVMLSFTYSGPRWQAYACLSDKYKRNLFTLGRSKARCRRCVLTSRMQSPTPSFGYFHEHQQKVSAQQKPQAPVSITKTSPSEWKSDAEKLQIFRERARARVSSLEQAWEARNAKRNIRDKTKADRAGSFGDSCRDRSDKSDCFSELRQQLDQMERESRQGLRDYYSWRTSSRQSQTPEGKTGDRTFTSLKDFGRQKKKEKPNVSQSLDDLLNMLRAENSAYARRDFVNSRGEPKNGMKEDCMSAGSNEGTAASSDYNHDSLNSSSGHGKANSADSGVPFCSTDKFLADFARSVDLAFRQERTEVEDIPTAADQTCRGVDSLYKGESSSVHSSGLENGGGATRTPGRSDRRPPTAFDRSASCTESQMTPRPNANDLSKSHQQNREDKPVPFREGNLCTCNISEVESAPVLARCFVSEPVVFDPMCNVIQGDGIDKLSLTRIGEYKCRDKWQYRDELLVSESSRASCEEIQSPKPSSHAMRNLDVPSVHVESFNVCFSESQLSKHTAEDSAHQATPSSLTTPPSTGRASVRCKSFNGGIIDRDGSVHAISSPNVLGMNCLVSTACQSSLFDPTRASDSLEMQTGVLEHRSVVVDKLSNSPATLNHRVPSPLTEAAKNTEDVDAFLQNESTPGSEDASLQATSGRGERLRSLCLQAGEDRQPEKDIWSFLDLDREQTIMREHKEVSPEVPSLLG